MDITSPGHEARPVSAPRGSELNTLGWQQEGALRMLMNNLDPEVAEHPDNLVVYGGTGRAARSWAAFDAMAKRAAGEKIETVNTVYPNVYDGVEGMLFITQCVESSKQNGGWLPFRHAKSRK